MRLTLLALPVAAALLVSSLAAEPHHSFASTYDVNKHMTLKGKMVQVSFRMPHSFFYVEVEDKGTVRRWVIEGTAGTQFAQQGVDKDTFKIGDPVEVVVNPARSPNITRARLIKITRITDGKTYEAGTGEPSE